MGGNRFGERLAQAGMGQDEIRIRLEQRQLLTEAVFALTRRGTAPSHRRHALTQAEIEPLHKGRVNSPAAGSEDLLARCVPNTMRCFTATRRRRRMVLTTYA
jgi:hypothetical protein